jgi:hypothetical protein
MTKSPATNVRLLNRSAAKAVREIEDDAAPDQREVLEQFDTETVRAFQQMIDSDRE